MPVISSVTQSYNAIQQITRDFDEDTNKLQAAMNSGKVDKVTISNEARMQEAPNMVEGRPAQREEETRQQEDVQRQRGNQERLREQRQEGQASAMEANFQNQPIEGMVNQMVQKRQLEANARTIKTANDMVGNTIDLMA